MNSPAELTSRLTIGRDTPSLRVAAALAATVLAAGCSIDERAVSVAPSRQDTAPLQNQAAAPMSGDGAGGGAATATGDGRGSSAETDGSLMPGQLMQPPPMQPPPADAARPPEPSGPEGSSANAGGPAATPKPATSCQSPTCCASATLQGIGFLPGDQESYVSAVSGDGRTLVGVSYGPPVYIEQDIFDTPERAMRWVLGSGMLAMAGLESGSDSQADAVSFDGSVIAGWYRSPAVPDNGARWAPSTGPMQLLGDAIVTGSSNDGSIFSASDGRDAFRWQQAMGLVRLEPLAGFPRCYAEGISADGTAVVGYCSSDPAYVPRAVRWTADGPLDLGILPGASESWARAVSADGSVVAGWSTRDGVDIAFRWTRQAGMTALDTAEVSRITNAVSADGSVIVGGDDADAFLWTAGLGALPLRALLPPEALQAGTSGTGWALDAAQGISADGTVIVGTGNNPQGAREGWRITLGAECLE